jgi:plasmid maintenance system antidote protein VapI
MPVRPADVCQFLDRTGWSQARLAWELGINQPRISRFINGMKKPNPDLVRARVATRTGDGARSNHPHA